ncbi:MAG: oligosaccharide flippase family protein [candidate division KSB1 bacterium]|nr:oligosaccharide flippase family protein [candidate division KSB1 bacterium]
METAKRLTINAIFIMIAKGLQPIISFAMVLAIGRKLGVTAFGIFSTAISLVLIFQIIASFGLRTLITREVAKHRDQVPMYIVNSLYIAIPLSLIAAGLMVIVVNFVLQLDAEAARMTSLLALSLPATAVLECFEGVLAGVEKIKTISYIYLAENIIKVGVCVGLILLGYQLLAVILVHIVTRYMAVSFYLPTIMKLGHIADLKPDWGFIKQFLKTAHIFALIMVLVTMYWNIDVVFLNHIAGNDAAGIYSGAKRFVLFLITLIQSFFTAFFPVISGLYESQSENFQYACKKTLQYLMVVTVPIAVIMTLMASKIFYFTFGAGFEQSASVLKILIWIIIPYSMSQVFAYALLASNNQKIDIRVNCAALASNVILTIVLSQRFGYIGTAIAALIAIFIYVGLQIPFVFRRVIKFDYAKMAAIAGKMVLSAGAMLLVILLLDRVFFISLAVLAVIIYFALLYLFKAFAAEDLNFIKSLLKKKPSEGISIGKIA